MSAEKLPSTNPSASAPSDYLMRLVGEALKYFQPQDKELPKELEDCDREIAKRIRDLARSAADEAQRNSGIEGVAALMETQPRFQERLALAINYSPSKWLLEQEQPYLKLRRDIHHLQNTDTGGTDPYRWASEQQVQGICLSGGGIRSATFNLGVLQGLASLDLLKNFDYLSSVSGGGYIHEFLAAWIKREEENAKAGPPAQGYQPGQGFREVMRKLDPLPNREAAAFHPEPIKWLRRYSNYLTPAKGVFSADMWVAVAIWLRNTFLNQIVLLSGLLMLVLILRFISRALQESVSPQWLAVEIGLLFLIVGVYLGLALRAEYSRIRHQDMIQSGEGAMRRWVPWHWISGEAAALGLAIAPLLLAACLALDTLLSGALADSSAFVLLEVLVCLLFVSLMTAFAGGAAREHALAIEKSRRRRAGGIWLCCWAGSLAACLGTLAFGGVWLLLGLLDWYMLLESCSYRWEVMVVIGPLLLFSIPFLTLVFGAGLVGRDFTDWMREWLARIRAWSLMLGLFWIGAFAIVLLGPYVIDWLPAKASALVSTLKWTTVAGWIATTAGSLFAGKSGKTSGRKDETSASSYLDLLASVGPYVYIVGLLVLLSWAASKLTNLPGSETYQSLALVLVPALLIFLLFGFRVDINAFSLNPFYRNRLTRCYLGASNSRRDPSPLTGFDDRDTRGMQISRLLPRTPRAMAEGNERPDFVPYTGPFPIICTTLNLTFGEDLAWQERKAASFAFTPLYSGYTVGWTAGRRGERLSFNGFVPTFNYAFPDGGINIATAVAISGAAASPNGGYHTNPAIAFLMTMFDVRLGWWIRNPRKLAGLAGQSPLVRGHKTDRASPRFAPAQLAKELLGMTDDRSNYVYLSDGGHFDNMGLYELVRRRCYSILICDGEEDEKYVFEGLGMAIRKCRIDFGVEITLGDLKQLQADPNTGCSHAHFAVGTIRYPEAESRGWPRREGSILYLKSSLTGAGTFTLSNGSKKMLCTEPADILNYKLQHEKFPHDPTMNQWFTESQFESYRRLGCHVVDEVRACGMWEPFS